MKQPDKKIIFALDKTDLKSILLYSKQIGDFVNSDKNIDPNSNLHQIFAIKIGILTILENGISIIRKIKEVCPLEIIVDLKLADIPFVAAQVAQAIQKEGGDYLVVHCFVGKKVIEAIKEATPELKIILLSEMTHNNGGYTSKHLEEFSKLALDYKVFGIIGPGNRVQRISLIKSKVQNKVNIIAAGVSSEQHGSIDSSITAGADYYILGRPIIEELDKINVGINKLNRKKICFYFAVYFMIVIISILLNILSILPHTYTISISVGSFLAFLGHYLLILNN